MRKYVKPSCRELQDVLNAELMESSQWWVPPTPTPEQPNPWYKDNSWGKWGDNQRHDDYGSPGQGGPGEHGPGQGGLGNAKQSLWDE